MLLGICTSVDNAAACKAAGADFIEENVQSLLQGEVDTPDWTGPERTRRLALPVLAANCLLPRSIPVAGPAVDPQRSRTYMERVLSRAGQLGIKTLVFGSGNSRRVPDGFDPAAARQQIFDFVSMAAPIAKENDVMLVIEPLRAAECNILNSVPEAMEYVRRVNQPNLQCLVDSYHWWAQDESLDDLAKVVASIKHVHVADRETRLPPGESASDYRPFFGVLKRGGYDGPISVEAKEFKDIRINGPRVMDYLRSQWEQA